MSGKEKMNMVKAIKTFFEQEDEISPEGGQKITASELMEYKKGGNDLKELAQMCADALGVELE